MPKVVPPADAALVDGPLTLPAQPTPANEEPVLALPTADRYVVMHTMVDTHAYGAVVKADELGDANARSRLLGLGAIAPIGEAIVRLAQAGQIELANALRSQA